MVRIAYLGPEGTFSEAALLGMTSAGLIPGGSASEPVPTDSTPAALDAVRDGVADYACVPIENSIDGTVLPFTYPPIAAVLFAPFTWVSLGVATAALTVVSTALLVVSIAVVLAGLGVGAAPAPGWCCAARPR